VWFKNKTLIRGFTALEANTPVSNMVIPPTPDKQTHQSIIVLPYEFTNYNLLTIL
jgi:hypothetical protein